MTDFVFRNDALRVTLTQEHDALWLTLDDLATGKRWGKSPLLAIDVHDKALRRTSSLTRYQIDQIEEVPGGVHVVIGDRGQAIDIGLWVRLEDGELAITLLPAEVYERHPELYRVFAINILPGMLQASAGEKLVLPINTGMLCDPGNKPERSDRFLIYGEQDRWELMPTLPICAAHTGEGGMMAMMVAGACDAECRVATDGRGEGTIGFAFSFRRYWPDPVDMDRRELRFTPIPTTADPIVFIAKRLRRHIIEDLGKTTLKQRMEESPEVAYLLDAYTMKLFHGMEHEGYLVAGSERKSPVTFVTVMTFAEAAANLKKLHDAGIPKIYTQNVGWNSRGHDGFYPLRFPIEERLGGEKGFREMVAAGTALGYQINAHDNYIMGTKRSPATDLDLIIHDLYGEPLVHGCWAGGIEFSHWGLALPEERLTGNLQRMKALGLQGMAYNDYMGQPLEVNYHPKHRGPRADCARGINRIIEASGKVFGATGTESGFLYCSIPADGVAAYPKQGHLNSSDPSWPIMSLLDKRVPIWQLALHGLVSSENSTGPDWNSAMETILFADHPRDEWAARPGIMPVLDDTRIRALKAMFDLFFPAYGHLQAEELVDYKEPADGVRQTTFSDGTVVTVDDGKAELFVNDRPVPKPEGLLESK